MKHFLFLSLFCVLCVGAFVWVVGATANLCCGHGLRWQHRSGINLYAFGIDQHGVGVVRNTYPNVAQLPNETDVGGSGDDLSKVSFGIGLWRHVYKYDYFSPVPKETYDSQKVSQYSKVIVSDAKMFYLDLWPGALLLALLSAAAFLKSPSSAVQFSWLGRWRYLKFGRY